MSRECPHCLSRRTTMWQEDSELYVQCDSCGTKAPRGRDVPEAEDRWGELCGRAPMSGEVYILGMALAIVAVLILAGLSVIYD